jgi:hypothetical protein
MSQMRARQPADEAGWQTEPGIEPLRFPIDRVRAGSRAPQPAARDHRRRSPLSSESLRLTTVEHGPRMTPAAQSLGHAALGVASLAVAAGLLIVPGVRAGVRRLFAG